MDKSFLSKSEGGIGSANSASRILEFGLVGYVVMNKAIVSIDFGAVGRNWAIVRSLGG